MYRTAAILLAATCIACGSGSGRSASGSDSNVAGKAPVTESQPVAEVEAEVTPAEPTSETVSEPGATVSATSPETSSAGGVGGHGDDGPDGPSLIVDRPVQANGGSSGAGTAVETLGGTGGQGGSIEPGGAGGAVVSEQPVLGGAGGDPTVLTGGAGGNADEPPVDPCDGVECPSSQRCEDGVCGCYNENAPTWCNDLCRNLLTDNGNCGSCGNQCDSIYVCVEGQCQCPPGQTLCDDECVNLNVNELNCGACGHSCQPYNIGIFYCSGGCCVRDDPPYTACPD